MDDLFTAPRARVEGIPDDVSRLFERLTLKLINENGFKHYSADAILHRIRWHFQVERRLREFKCNNNWTAVLARWFMQRHPEHEGFFETRSSPHKGGSHDFEPTGCIIRE